MLLPGALLIALRGLRTRSTRRIFRKPIPEPPKMDIKDTETTTISRQLKAYIDSKIYICIAGIESKIESKLESKIDSKIDRKMDGKIDVK